MPNHEHYMRRALRLALKGAPRVSPNPMVGAVIVAPDGRIIGEGYHRHWGGPHAEVNAVRSVSDSDRHLLGASTIYVTLEPCSHYGKTPPCSQLLIAEGIPRIVVGIKDPFEKVSGRGIQMLRDAGREVIVGVLETECRLINNRFFTAHTLRRPWIQLKWAQSADGFMGSREQRAFFSTPLTSVIMHRERAMADAIMVGTGTVVADNPRLDTRLWPGRSPRPVTFSSDRLPVDATILQRDPILLDSGKSLQDNMHILYEKHGVTSLMVEGGPTLLKSFIDNNLFDEIRVETSPVYLSPFGPEYAGNLLAAPTVPPAIPLVETQRHGQNTINRYLQPATGFVCKTIG